MKAAERGLMRLFLLPPPGCDKGLIVDSCYPFLRGDECSARACSPECLAAVLPQMLLPLS